MINHGSLYAHRPEEAAAHLAALCEGRAAPFHPCEGAWVCFLSGVEDDWQGPMVELYPRSVTLASENGQVTFRKLARRATGAGGHLNISVKRSRAALERVCRERNIDCAWRGWAGFLDVWLDPECLIELVPP